MKRIAASFRLLGSFLVLALCLCVLYSCASTATAQPGPARTVTAKEAKKITDEAQALNAEMSKLVLKDKKGYIRVNWVEDMKPSLSGRPRINRTARLAQAHASVELATRVSQIVASKLVEYYEELEVNGASDEYGSLTIAAEQIVVQELKGAETLWRKIGQHNYATVVGVPVDPVVRIAKKTFDRVAPDPGPKLKKNLPKIQEDELKAKRDKAKKELEQYIRKFLDKELP